MLQSVLRPALLSVTVACLGAAGVADDIPCPGTDIRVRTDTAAAAEALCGYVRQSLETLDACNVPLTHPVTVELRRALSPGCMGVYHCGDERIEILAPDAIQAARHPDSSLAFVGPEAYFQSILTHELAHAAFDAVPCPFDSCLATHEYVAHVMQVMSLPATDIARFEAALDMETPMSRDAINPMLYLMAPDAFLRRAWVHLRQRPDACGYIDDIMQGRVVLDYERFD